MINDERQAIILDHYRNPRRNGQLAAPDVSQRGTNPFCGDEVTIQLQVEDGVVTDAAFEGRGCSISQATASMLMEEIVGCTTRELSGWDKQRVLDLLGIEIGPVRQKCALLPLSTIQAGLESNVESE